MIFKLYFCSSDNDRLVLKVVGSRCVVQGSEALAKDQGIWDFHVVAGNDASYHKSHFQFHISVKGKSKIH